MTIRHNLIEEVTSEIARSEENGKLINNSPFLKDTKLSFNLKSLFSFVTAILYFELEKNPNFQNLQLKQQYQKIIEEEKLKTAFKLFYNQMLDYYNGKPSLDKALWNLSSSYIKTVWGINNEIKDPILLTAYSMALSKVRFETKNYFEKNKNVLFDEL